MDHIWKNDINLIINFAKFWYLVGTDILSLSAYINNKKTIKFIKLNKNIF